MSSLRRRDARALASCAPWLCSALLGSTLIACNDTASIAAAGDAAVGSDGGARDGGGSDARVKLDATPPPGTRIAELPADLVAVPPGGAEVLYLRAGNLMRVRPDGSESESVGLRPTIGYGPTPLLWLWSDVDADLSTGAVDLYRPGGAATTTRLDARAATDVFAIDEDGTTAILAVGIETTGDTNSSTRTADLASIDARGEVRVLMRGLTMGRWDMRTRQHVCAPQVEVMSPSRALAIVCPEPGRNTRVLVAIDMVTGTTATVARDVLPFLRASADRSFALFADQALTFKGTSPTGDRVVPLVESRRIGSVAFLAGSRLAYTTSSQDLMVASWPTLVPDPLLPLGVDAIEALSDDGKFLMFRQARAPTGLRDLYLVATSTGVPVSPEVLTGDPNGYPGDDPFSEDGAWVQWFTRADANFIGDVEVARTTEGTPRKLAERGWIIRNTGDPDRIALLMNARFAGDGRRLVADLALASRAGNAPLSVLVSGLDTSAFALFPEGDRAAFRISEGEHPGLWVRALEP